MSKIKKWVLAATLVCGTTTMFNSCSSNDNPAPTDPEDTGAPDYSKKSSWYKISEVTKEFDTFFIYPTEYMGSNEGDPDYAALDNPDMVQGAKNDHILMASTFEESTNLFMPYYRQASATTLKKAYDKTGDIRTALVGTPYKDITAALDYYFENYNNGRPFIIASHSQGSAINSLVLKTYFKEHPDYYKRMVASYMIGFSITRDWLKDNPHLKFATGEADTGVIVSWNTEGKQNVEQNATNVVVMQGAISINPLNWKLDDTYAPASENKGSLIIDEEAGTVSIGDIGADAQVNTERGVVVTNANSEPIALTDFFGPQSFHNGDYTFYYNNIKDNVAKRIATYQSLVKATDYSQKANWLQFPEITKDVDAFYIYSTVYVESSFEEGAPDYATLDNPEMIGGALGEYVTNASVFEESCNVFVPWYRQAGMRYATEVSKKYGNLDPALAALSYSDIKAALDYFFEKCNNGRPFVIAAHSQGAAMLRYVLKNYFKEHQDYYKRMVAAYAIGYSITKDDLEQYPYLKFAEGESDAGVIISWHTEGPNNTNNVAVLPGGISINPLNWKRDETYAPASENKGSLRPNKETGEYEIQHLDIDAQVNLARGVVVTTTTIPPTADPKFFGPASYHEDDYPFFYNNIKENVAKRIATYKANLPQ